MATEQANERLPVFDLIEKLRASPESRREYAFELARTRTPAAVTELMNMIEGNIHGYAARSWRTAWLRRPIRYSPEDQLLGVEAIAQTGSSQGLQYLRTLYDEQVSKERREDSICFGADVVNTSWTAEVHSYANAPEGLRHLLSYEIHLGLIPKIIEEDRISIPAKRPVHVAFRNSIATLENYVNGSGISSVRTK